MRGSDLRRRIPSGAAGVAAPVGALRGVGRVVVVPTAMGRPLSYPVVSADDSTTSTATLAVDVSAGSVPEVPPPTQVTCHAIDAVSRYRPPGAVREAVV
jgi:hypothetical protein